MSEEDMEPKTVDIIATSPGVIAGKGLVQVGSKHTIAKDAFSKQWMIIDEKTADAIMEIDPLLRYNVDLSAMSHDELKLLMAQMGLKTNKRAMKRTELEKLIKSKLVKIADDIENAERKPDA